MPIKKVDTTNSVDFVCREKLNEVIDYLNKTQTPKKAEMSYFKKCPLCGTNNIAYGDYWVRCNNCTVKITGCDSYMDILNKWNRRPR